MQVRAQDPRDGEELVDAGQRGPLAGLVVGRERRGRQHGRWLGELVERGRGRPVREKVEDGSADAGELREHVVRERRVRRFGQRRQVGQQAEDRLRRPDDHDGEHETGEQLVASATAGSAERGHRQPGQESVEHVVVVAARQRGRPRGERAAVHEEQRRREQRGGRVCREREQFDQWRQQQQQQQEAHHLGDRADPDGLGGGQVVQHAEEPAACRRGAVHAGPGLAEKDQRREQQRHAKIHGGQVEEGRVRDRGRGRDWDRDDVRWYRQQED